MVLTDYDKERLKIKYEQFCNKEGFASDVFDFDAELDSSLDYWEAWGNIEDKLELFKSALQTKNSNRPQETQQFRNTRPFMVNLDSTDSVAVLGDRNTGKTNLVFYMLNHYRGTRGIYLYGYPKEVKGFKTISSWSDLLRITNSIIFIDEIQRYFRLYDRRANNELMEFMSFLAHQKNTLVFTTQLSQFITKGVEASIQTWIIKNLDIAGLKNGSKPKRVLREVCDIRITDKGMSLGVNELVAWDNIQPTGFNGVYTFEFQGVGKDWGTVIPTKTTTKPCQNLAKINNVPLILQI